MKNYTLKFEINNALAEVRLNAFLPNGEKFASHSLTNDEIDWVEPNKRTHTYTDFYNYVQACVPYSEAEELYEFLDSLDEYAKQHEKQTSVKTSWSCLKCGATTTDPKHALIKWFHDGCKG